MKSKLKKWLKSHYPFPRAAYTEDGDDIRRFDRTHLPEPGDRTHALTPSPSQETLPQSCALFTALPYEIRRAILIEAFGARTVHMHLTFDHPPVPRLQPGESPYVHHAGWDKQIRGGGSTPLKVDRSRGKRWLWSGSVCHRNAPWMPETPTHYLYAWHGPWYDYCQAGYAEACHSYPGKVPESCKIGAIGWLLTCRQAYVEGIDVLYRTNTISLGSQILILNLSKLVLPQRLASIVSLEVSLEAHTLGSDGDWALDISHFPHALDSIASSLPSLKRLYISIKSDIYSRGRLDHASIIKHMDDFYRRVMSHVETLALALPVTTASEVTGTAERQEETRPEVRFAAGAVWRCFDGESGPRTQFRYFTYPKRPLKLPEGSSNVRSSGYWILPGNDDNPRYVVCF